MKRGSLLILSGDNYFENHNQTYQVYRELDAISEIHDVIIDDEKIESSNLFNEDASIYINGSTDGEHHHICNLNRFIGWLKRLKKVIKISSRIHGKFDYVPKDYIKYLDNVINMLTCYDKYHVSYNKMITDYRDKELYVAFVNSYKKEV